MERNEVNVAFEILIEEIESVADALHEAGADAFRRGDYDRARKAIEEATRLAEFREKVKGLQKEWSLLSLPVPRAKKHRGRKRTSRLSRGLRTPEEAFRRPILESLVELGGTAPIDEVLERVEKKTAGVLNEHDYQPLPSNPRLVRWRNTAQWCRNTLVREGLMKRDSPHGIWEISNAGETWIKEEASHS